MVLLEHAVIGHIALFHHLLCTAPAFLTFSRRTVDNKQVQGDQACQSRPEFDKWPEVDLCGGPLALKVTQLTCRKGDFLRAGLAR